MKPLKAVVRPLNEAEKRWLRLASARQSRFLKRMAPVVMLVVGVVLFGGLWGLTVLATKADKTGPSWRVSGLIWLALGIPISLWSYRDVRRHMLRSDTKFDGALRQNTAVEIRIQSGAVLVLAENQDKQGCYAFQLPNRRIVFIVGKVFRRSVRFPNSDFSVVDIGGEKGGIVGGFVRKHGARLKPVRTIPLAEAKIPEHMSVIDGELDQVEQWLTH